MEFQNSSFGLDSTIGKYAPILISELDKSGMGNLQLVLGPGSIQIS